MRTPNALPSCRTTGQATRRRSIPPTATACRSRSGSTPAASFSRRCSIRRSTKAGLWSPASTCPSTSLAWPSTGRRHARHSRVDSRWPSLSTKRTASGARTASSPASSLSQSTASVRSKASPAPSHPTRSTRSPRARPSPQRATSFAATSSTCARWASCSPTRATLWSRRVRPSALNTVRPSPTSTARSHPSTSTTTAATCWPQPSCLKRHLPSTTATRST